MSVWTVLLDIVVLLGAGALLGGLFERMRQSAIVGYLVAGALLGPNCLHVIDAGDEVVAVSELGVALLLFVIGLEFSWRRLRGMGRVVFGSGIIQIVATGLVAASVALLVGLGGAAAVTIGAICALSSTACVLRILTSRGEIESAHGERALGILLVQDMAVVPLVLVVSVLRDGGSTEEMLLALLRTAGVALALIGGLYVLFNHVVPRILSTAPMRGNRELPLLIAIVSGLGSGVIAHAAGVSPALGAFVAGMLLAESPFALQVRADVSGFKTVLLTLFFTAMGMLSDPAWIASNAPTVAAVVAAIVLGKAAVVWFALRILGTRKPVAIASAICLAQVGEFSFVLAEIGRGTLIDEPTFMLIVSTTVITMILTPYLVGGAPRVAGLLARRSPVASSASPGVDIDDDSRLAIVVGFGPAGRAASQRLADLGCSIVIVDQNPAAAHDARALGYGVVTGDAEFADVLEHAGLARASVFVVTVPQTRTALQIVRLVAMHGPGCLILVRARFHLAVVALQDAGAHAVIDEEHEVGRQIAAAFREIQVNSKDMAV